MRRRLILATVLASLCFSASASGTEEIPAPTLPSVPVPVITAQARDALTRMGQHLQSSKSLAFTADVEYDVLIGDGQMIRYGSRVKAAWQPGKRLHVQVDGDEQKNRIYVDNGRVAWVDDMAGIYATETVPGDLDAAIDDLVERLDLKVPLLDLFYKAPHSNLIESAHWGRQVGVHDVQGVPCIHLAFVADGLDWQVWIEVGDNPVPRKLVIDYRDQEGSPTYSATLTQWDLNAKLDDDFAKFTPSPSEAEVDFQLELPSSVEVQP